ncbi:MAG: dTDP-4-dehydrorhamnose 3,5-epimerase [Chloroflexota bacterium]
MQVIQTELPGLVLLEPVVHGDARGFLVETYRRDEMEEAGIRDHFVLDVQSRSGRGTLRGLHFQVGAGQAKLVRVSQGTILDVVVDVRRSSPTFGRHQALELDDVLHRQLYVPVGFAHGFCVVSDVADVCYRLSTVWDPDAERGIAWDDPDLGIDWPEPHPILSDRDRAQPPFREIRDDLPTW